jgi:Ca2+-binding EF-hand superfamily protein
MTNTNVQRLMLAGTALAMFGAAPLYAQAAGSAAQPQQISRAQLSQQLDSEFKDLDASKDGKLTKPEIQAAMTRRATEAQAELRQQLKADFDKLDTNHNGQLSLSEYQAQASVAPRPEVVDARIQQLDTNKDGAISAEEYRNGTLTQFDRVDANHDGIVSAAEAGATR